MAYFSNGTEGISFAEQCELCRYGKGYCPVNYIQMEYNYKAVNNSIASEILNDLVKNNGDCEMFKIFKKDFALTEGEKAQQELF